MTDEPRRRFTFHPDDESTVSWRIGDVCVTRVVEGISEFPRGFLPGLTDERIEACLPWAAPYVRADHRRFLLSVHAFVIESHDHVIVVDTCVGPHADGFLLSDPAFERRLTDAVPGGLEGIDVVVCTHVHFDHVGWNTTWVGDRLVPRFPNARYLITDDELAAAEADPEPNDAWDPCVQPLLDAGVVDRVATDHRIDEAVRLVPSPGHTPGHVCVAIESDGQHALITGDSSHSPLQFAFPDASAEIADADTPQAIATRRQMVADLADADVLVLGTHFPTPTAGRIRTADGSVWFDSDDEKRAPGVRLPAPSS